MEREMMNDEAASTATEAGEWIVREKSCHLQEINARIGYVLTAQSGASRAAFGTSGSLIYNLTVRHVDVQDGEECCLIDIARREEEALALLDRFAEAGVTPVSAADVMDELLARM